ncbi:hypothetical protein AVEN_86867-1 [Araneus ventricosus]|uniref:Uncharacterized protein n=1 Tax=Araneus ventricosus TaxID=182803 RepID=A0A4Y2QQ11_ARAVE|nr:hypothetical protein AVEN_86867-1 [Araneus ventricosus]
MPNEEDRSAPSAFLGGLQRAAGPHSCEARGNQANPAQPARRRAAIHSRGLRLPVERASALGHWWGAEGALVTGSGPTLPLFISRNREIEVLLSLGITNCSVMSSEYTTYAANI